MLTKCVLYVDQKNESAKQAAAQTLAVLQSKGVQIVSEANGRDDLVVVFGGDGTMSAAVHKFKFEPVSLGINHGHDGFLMNDQSLATANRILNKQFEIHLFSLLRIEAENGWYDFAMGDVYFNRIGPKTCKFKISVNGAVISERIAGDGIVISTALGSTGYSVPAGGPAIYSKLPVISITPIVVNTPRLITPMVFPIQSVVEITLLSPPNEVQGFYDGLDDPLPYFEKIKITLARFRSVQLAFWEGEDLTARLVRKTMKTKEG